MKRIFLRSTIVYLGTLVLLMSLVRVWFDYNVYNSPLDQADLESGQENGFLPLYNLGKDPNDEFLAPELSTPGTFLQEIYNEFPDQLPRTNPIPKNDPVIKPSKASSETNNSEYYPDSLYIPAINLRAPIIPVARKKIEANGEIFEQWIAPDSYAVGWHATSSTLGEIGNSVLNGHHNIAGEVFRDLHLLEEGDQIFVYSGEKTFIYRVGLNLRLKERFQPVEVRLKNAQWILPSIDERLTLITCWPYESNTHRIIIVALPSEFSQDLQ